MFKILVVDDEKIVLDAVKFILDKNFADITLYETARSGREAIEKADMFNPHIIMMDIRMPGINGIEAIKEIKMRHPKTHFIIVSAYEQFDFAKEAVELKVDDYVLKPIIKNKLISVLRNIMDKITIEKELKKKELEVLEKYERVVPYLEFSFIYSIILGENSSFKLEQFKEILDFEADGGYIMLIESENNSTFLEERYAQDSENYEGYFSTISDALKCKCRCFSAPVMMNRSVAFIQANDEQQPIIKKEAIEIANYVNKKLLNINDKLKIKISIGSYQKLHKINKSFDEALMTIKLSKWNEIVHTDDFKLETEIVSEYPKDLEGKLLEQLKTGDLEGGLESFERIYKWIFKNYYNYFELGKSKFAEIFVVIHRTAFLSGVKEADYNNYLLELYKNEDYIKLEKWCNDRLADLIYNINVTRNRKSNRIILDAKEYIYENYNRDITLEEVAKAVNVNPHYFSRLFKEETGENFIEYLTIFRIKKAKKMMDTTNLNIKEICYKIGYTDPNYFSRLFKKVEKVTPTDYMKNSNKG